MLKLEKVELRGFKSFCDPTELVFPGALTAIVGPNGCGKSNIADAIAWVLGEQSARLLRGTRMEDVIFQGTRARPPLGMAEVVLTVRATADVPLRGEGAAEDDLVEGAEEPARASRRIWTADVIPAGTILTIGRRIYRSGESEYLIDGHPVRLRDIYDLFAGTGLGPGHYALIGQDRVAALIQAKPSERRGVIEEAAGITRLKMRERAAVARLDAARQNLQRLNDVIGEIERQVGGLRRQAARARRYRRLREELRALLRALFRVESRRVEMTLAEVEERRAKLEAEREALRVQIAALEAESHRLMERERERQRRVAEARDRLAEIQLERERLAGQRAQCEREIEELGARRHAVSREQEELTRRLALVGAEIVRLSGHRDRHQQEIWRREEEARAVEAQQQRHVEEVAQSERAVEQVRAAQIEAITQLAHWRNAGQRLEEALERLQAQIRRAEAERERAVLRQHQLEAERAQLLQELEARRAHLEALRAEREQLARCAEQARDQEARARQSEAEIEREAIAVENRLASLVELDDRRVHASRAVQVLFEVSRQNGGPRLLGTLADLLRVAPEEEALVEGFWGEWLQVILVPSLEDARAALAILDHAGVGRAHVLVVESAEEETADGIPSRSSDRPECSLGVLHALGLDPSMRRIVRRAFPECERVQIVSDLEAALRESRRDPMRIFLTRRGEWVRGGILISGGRRGDAAPSFLAVKREIRQLRARREELRRQLEQVRRDRSEREQTLRALRERGAQLEAAVAEHERALLRDEMRLTEIERDLGRAHQHLQVIEFEREEAERERIRLQQEWERVQIEQQRAEEHLRALEQAQRAEQEALDAARRASAELAERLSALRVERAAWVERLHALEGQIRRLQHEEREIRRRLEVLGQDEIALQKAEQAARERLGALERQERALEEAHRRAHEEVQDVMGPAEEERFSSAELAERLSALRQKEAELRDRIQQEEIARAELLVELRYLNEQCASELGQSVIEVLESDETGEISEADPQALRARLEEVRRKIEELGPVNLMALDELQQVEERLSFLRTQREDVERSIASTEEALEEIRRRARQRLLKAFEAINAHFHETFRELFGGGQGRMVLLDPEDVTESGVEIVAQPPGKRLQNIQLLSGGEKALTALALLLAIFRYRPSPFCVLDEVDAPLDDMNVVRFCRQIVEMSRQTQFVLITHNKATMEVADVLYGVTMEEPGVSKVVSVRLQ